MVHEPLPKPFIDFVAHFRYLRIEECKAAMERMAGTPYADLCSAYMSHISDPVASRDAMLALADLPANIVPWRFHWLGTAYVLLGQLPEGEANFSQAIDTATDDQFKCRVYVNWAGGIVTRNTDNDPEMARRAISVIERAMLLNPPEATAIMLSANLGICYKILDRYDEAIQIFERVRDYNLTQENEFVVALSTSDIADIYRLKGDLPAALEHVARSWEIIKDLDVPVSDKIGILTMRVGIERDAGKLDDALQSALLAIQMAEDARAQVVSERDRISYFATLRDCYDEAILCYLALNDPAKAFDITERARARTLADLDNATPVTLADIKLPPNRAIVSYYAVKGDLMAFVIADGKVVAQCLGDITTIEQAFDSDGYLRNMLPGSGGKLRKAFVLDRIAEQIARPLHPLLEDYDRLCLIPFGALHHVPLGTMFDQETFTAPSVTVLATRRLAPSQGLLPVAFGYNGNTLKHAEAEAHAVGKVVYTGEYATSASLFAHAHRAKWLHLSAHGVFDSEHPMQSYIELADGPLYADQIAAKLRLSADLVVLSACDSGRNKMLRGDEPMGLIRAFMAAGASSVMVALWPVNETSTRIFMENFYSALRSSGSATKALSIARERLRIMRRSELPAELARPGLSKGKAMEIALVTDDPEYPFAHPYWWAGFTLVGDRF